jgi:serine/threonine protein kinase
MKVSTPTKVLELLKRLQLLTPSQCEQLTGIAADLDSRQLAGELLQRNWLTPFQVNQLLIGRAEELMVGPYAILERLGEGGSGQVFKARHQRMGRLAALKLIRRELVADRETVERFLREIRVVSQLSHPNVVHTFDAGPIGPTYYLAMEYVEGTDLSQMVKETGPLPVAQACDYIRQAALGLQHAHERGLVHRDVKPPNFLVNQTGKGRPDTTLGQPASSWGVVKLLDLGLARLQRPVDGERTSMLTQSGPVMMGTPDYLAPEQALNFRGVDIRADIYGLGCTLFYLLTGQPPFPGGTLAQKLMCHQQVECPAIGRYREDVPPELNRELRRMLAKHPDDRPQAPQEVADALAALHRKGYLPTGPAQLREDFTIADELPPEVAISLRRENVAPGSPPSGEGVLRQPSSALSDRIRRPNRRWFWIPVAAVPVLGLLLMSVFARPETGPSATSATPLLAQLPPQSSASEPDIFALWNEPKADRERLRPELLQILRTRPGTSDARQAATCLRQIPSSLDRIDAKAIPAEKRDPTELVAQVGEARTGAEGLRVAFSPEGQWLASAGDDARIRLWRIEKLDDPPVVLVGHTTRVTHLTFSPTGQALASLAVGDSAPTVWDLSGQIPPPRAQPAGHKAVIRALAFSPDATMLATAANDTTIRFWGLSTKGFPEVSRRIGPAEVVHALAFSPDGQVLASTGTDQTIRLWDGSRPGPRGEKFQVPHVQQKHTPCLEYSPDGKLVVAAGVPEPGGMGGLSLWAGDATVNPPRRVWDVPGRHVTAIAFSPDSKLLAVCFLNGEIIVQDTSDWRRTRQWHRPGGIQSLAFAPDGRHLAVANPNGIVSILRLETLR